MSAATGKKLVPADGVGLPLAWGQLGKEGDLVRPKTHVRVQRCSIIVNGDGVSVTNGKGNIIVQRHGSTSGGGSVVVERHNDEPARVWIDGREVDAKVDTVGDRFGQCLLSDRYKWERTSQDSVDAAKGRCRVGLAVANALAPSTLETEEYRDACAAVKGLPPLARADRETHRVALCAVALERETGFVLGEALRRWYPPNVVDEAREKVEAYAPKAKSQQQLDDLARRVVTGQEE